MNPAASRPVAMPPETRRATDQSEVAEGRFEATRRDYRSPPRQSIRFAIPRDDNRLWLDRLQEGEADEWCSKQFRYALSRFLRHVLWGFRADPGVRRASVSR